MIRHEITGQIVQQSVSNMRIIASLTREDTFKDKFNTSLKEPHKLLLKVQLLWVLDLVHHKVFYFSFGRWLFGMGQD